jgi:hypothetical protein
MQSRRAARAIRGRRCGAAPLGYVGSAAAIWSMEDIVALIEMAEAVPKTRRP